MAYHAAFTDLVSSIYGCYFESIRKFNQCRRSRFIFVSYTRKKKPKNVGAPLALINN